ncbi:hypothetical protein AGMMS49942_22330 [Spirochaetia bacterium]|nr:hypothetical protein AGMMS49942_22330 [Spirochaetia bacterium]
METNQGLYQAILFRRMAGFAVPFVAAIFFLILVGCGGGNPKTLAKQTYDIGQQALGAMFNPAKAAELTKKAEDIEKKVAKLSEKDRAIYDEELARLAGNALGGLFKAATDAAGGTEDLLKAASNAADALDTEAVKDAAKAASDAADAVNNAANALKSFGF